MGAFIFLAAVFRLTTIMWLIERMATVAIIAIVVIFQPELRKALEQLGTRNFIINLFPITSAETGVDVVNEIVRACFEMGKKKTGALIVLQQRQSLADIEATGIRVNGLVSAALLINIFEKNTPLHDGAVVISGDIVTAATCYLPLTESEISKDYGTRHRAALGVSEVTDAVTIVVSEETGSVSVAVEGKLIKTNKPEVLRAYIPMHQEEAEKNTRFHLFRFGKGEKAE